jgi:hypothetical protein
MMSPASSGGVWSSVSLTAATMWPTGSSSAWRTSSELSSIVFGSPLTRSRPRISVRVSVGSGAAEPASSLTSSAVWAPIASL